MPRKRHAAHENHERWLVSYADFITLLFAFFVVMFASSQADKGKAHQMQEAVKRALDDDKFLSTMAGILGGTPDDKGKGNAQIRGPGGAQQLSSEQPKQGQFVELLPALDVLHRDLEREIASGQMSVSMEARGLVVSFKQAAFFPSGADEIPPQTYETVAKVAEVIGRLPNPVRLEGHTDAVPLRGSGKFRSNWELSAARSIAMMELLAECCGIRRERLSVAGYAENAPIADNNTEEGRRQNRRVDIVILNQTGVAAEPSQSAQRTR